MPAASMSAEHTSPTRPAHQPTVGRVSGPLFKPVQSLLYAFGDVTAPHRETVHAVEEALLEYFATLVERMLAVPPLSLGADALAVARDTANSRDGSGLAAAAVQTATPLRMDTLLFVLREQPHLFERVKHIWAAAQQQQEADGAAKKAAAKAAKAV